jgi:hypothetical protein
VIARQLLPTTFILILLSNFRFDRQQECLQKCGVSKQLTNCLIPNSHSHQISAEELVMKNRGKKQEMSQDSVHALKYIPNL